MRGRYVLIGVVVGVLLSSAVVVLAGSLDPPTGPTDAESQMYRLEQIYNRLDRGEAGTRMTSFTEPSSGPGTGTMHSLDDIMAIAPAPDDTNGAEAADVASGKTFWGLTASSWGLTTGTAAAKADPPCYNNYHRYVNCENGTVYDTVTNLLWLRDANCFVEGMDWTGASNAVLGLEDGVCGLTDGSSPGDWRLPTKAEWVATVEQAVALGCTYQNGKQPALVNKPGTECHTESWPAFNNVQASQYWSSTANELAPMVAWYMSLYGGTAGGNPKTEVAYVWAVREGH